MAQFIPDTSFPLYDLLLNKCDKMIEEDSTKEDITVQEVREMIDGIQSFDKDRLEHVFVIIRIHSLRNEKTINLNLFKCIPSYFKFLCCKSCNRQKAARSNV